MKNLKFAISPCPNDTYIFADMIDSNFTFLDIDQLNQNAIEGNFDVMKISTFAYANPKIFQNYQILDSGSALGKNNGPMLVAKNKFDVSQIDNKKILIPGLNTTANLLFTTFFPNANNKEVCIFSDIEKKILAGDADCGLLIHEGRFTYHTLGLEKIVDFGNMWEENFAMPIPLGFIIAKRSLGKEKLNQISNRILESIKKSDSDFTKVYPLIKSHAQQMAQDVVKSHINLYVNEFSKSLGTTGKKAINFMYQKALEHNLINQMPKDIFDG